MKILIAAATSNSGKTTLTMGLMRAMKNRGFTVQPYKCGPDYIDTMFHEISSGRESVNLDTFMSSKEHVRGLFDRYGYDADCRIVEGVMGMYDGYDRWYGSSADVAMTLDIPVILVVNARSVAYSVAPLIHGFKSYTVMTADGPRKPSLAGVIFNMVASDNHYHFLKTACEDAGVRCFGCLPRNEKLVIPGRHLGLTITEREKTEKLISLAAEEVEKHVDLDAIGKIGGSKDDIFVEELCPDKDASVIAVANDEAFNFTYRANIDALRQRGRVVFFSPLRDKTLPECDMLYLPGGYPELFADQLATNKSMRESIKAFAEAEGRVYAECGGFMYLCQDIDGKQMCGVLPMRATMNDARLHLGYRQMKIGDRIIRGHEFHYSSIIKENLPNDIVVEQIQQTAKGTYVPTAIYKYKNVLAGYTHWYWGESKPCFEF